MLVLVLLVVFALSTFHVHSHGSTAPDLAVTVVAVDNGAHGGDSSPDVPDRHAAFDCPVCALLTHLLGSSSTQVGACCDGRSEPFTLGYEFHRGSPLFEFHRPPIARAV